MTVQNFSRDFLVQIKTHAADPASRSDTAAMASNSTSLESLLAGLGPVEDPQMRGNIEGLQGAVGNLMRAVGMLSPGEAAPFAMVGPSFGAPGGTVSFGRDDPAEAVGALAGPCREEDVARAEAELGFPLPAALRQLYREVADGGFGPGDGLYSLAGLVAKYREMTEEPVGADGEMWPAELLPVTGADWDIIALDRNSGRLVYFDAEELMEGGWDCAFKPEAGSLEEWLGKWMGARGGTGPASW